MKHFSLIILLNFIFCIGNAQVKTEAAKMLFKKQVTFNDIIYLSLGSANKILELDSNKKIIYATKLTAYNKNFGTTSGTICQGNDSRLTTPGGDANYVHIAGTETITGTKTFSLAPVLSSVTASHVLTVDASKILSSEAKGTGFNKNFGTTSGTVAQGDDSRFTDTRTPSNDSDIVHKAGTETITGTKTFSLAPVFSSVTASHVLTVDASKILSSEAKGTGFNKDFGTTSGTVAQGDDSRFTDTRTPSNDADIVHKAGTETITGIKTFDTRAIFADSSALFYAKDTAGVFWKFKVNVSGVLYSEVP